MQSTKQKGEEIIPGDIPDAIANGTDEGFSPSPSNLLIDAKHIWIWVIIWPNKNNRTFWRGTLMPLGFSVVTDTFVPGKGCEFPYVV